MIAGFHTAGLLLHDLPTAIEALGSMGFGAVAIRPRRGSFDPAAGDFSAQLASLSGALKRAGVVPVIDADGWFMHDPLVRLGPSLVAVDTQEAAAAQRWISGWITTAAALDAPLVTFAAGAPSAALGSVADETMLEQLGDQLNSLLIRARQAGVVLALRPAAGHAVATVAQFERLQHWVEHADQLRLAADLGEMLAGGELPASDRLARNADSLSCVYLCERHSDEIADRRIGQGEVALGRVVTALADLRFAGPVIVRVEGHRELGLATAAEARQLFPGLEQGGSGDTANRQ